MTATFTVHSSVSELADRYDGFILDQFGVMHNGVTSLEGAPECVEKLKKQGKKIIILSNSSALSSSTVEKLPKLGFDAKDFVGAVTSGEEASHYVKDTYNGKKCLFMTWKTPKSPSPATFLEHCGDITVTDDETQADFILLHGCEVLRGPGPDGEATEKPLGGFMESGDPSQVIEPLLKKCLSLNLPMVCVNPDFIYVKPDGSVGHMPGKVAQLYEGMGGSVISFGKPHREHFEACIRELELPKEKVVHVGDSLHHDVAGANATGISSILVVGGVHRDELGCELGSLPSNESLAKLFETHKQQPTHVVPLLKY